MPDFSDILLTVDFDRTLSAPDASIPQRNLDAVRYFIDHGGSFTINTGRSLAMYKQYFGIIPNNVPLLLFNGSAAYDTQREEFTFCHTIDMDMAEAVRICLDNFPEMTPEVQGKEAHYAFRDNPMWVDYNAGNGCRACYAQLGEDIGPFIKIALYGQFHEPTISHLFRATPEEMERCNHVEQEVRRLLGDKVEVFRSGARIIDIHAKGVSKAKSARLLQEQLGKKWLVCVGDAENDVAMLQNADFAYCPADGVIADRFETVCPCADGAVADVIYKKIPEILTVQP